MNSAKQAKKNENYNKILEKLFSSTSSPDRVNGTPPLRHESA
jgi:hypothetical protein